MVEGHPACMICGHLLATQDGAGMEHFYIQEGLKHTKGMRRTTC